MNESGGNIDPYFFGFEFIRYLNFENSLLTIRAFFNSGLDFSVFNQSYEDIEIGYNNYLKQLGGLTIVNTELPFLDDFSNEYEFWAHVSISGDDQWHISPDDGIDGSKCARFYITSNPQQSNDDWLVSPIFNTEGLSTIAFEFKYWYYNNGIIPEFYYSQSFDGNISNSEWIELENGFWGDELMWNDAQFEIEDPGESFVFAIRYQSDESQSVYFLMDNFSIDIVTSSGELAALNYNNLKVYPNPMNNKSTVSFTIINSGNVTLAIYDSKGRKLYTILDEKLASGNHKYQLDKNNLISGLYFISLLTEKQQSNIKLILSD